MKRTTFDIPLFGVILPQMLISQIKCTGTEWKNGLMSAIASLKVGEEGGEILLYDFQHPGDNDWCRKIAVESGLKFRDKPETNTASIEKEA